MFGRPRNRRRPTERALKAPATNWRAVGLTLGTVVGVAALASAVSWAFDQPIETVAVTGRFQRVAPVDVERAVKGTLQDRKSTRLNSSHSQISYAVFCLKKKKKNI